MARHQKPDPWQQVYERQKAAGFPQPVPATPPQVPATSPQAAARPVASVSPRKLIVGGLARRLTMASRPAAAMTVAGTRFRLAGRRKTSPVVVA
jgi:hypothetical protein